MQGNGTSWRALLAFFVLFNIVFIPFKLSAESTIPEVKLSVKPLDLTRTPTNEELMAAGQLGGQLYPTHDIADKIKEEEINLDFGRAIQEWNKHNYREGVVMFKQYVKDYPDSPWAAEADLHVGCDATYNGRYTEAEEIFTKLINENKSSTHFGAKILLNKARQRLAILKESQGNFKEAIRLFAELKKESPDWKHRTYAAHWIQTISQYKTNELALMNCGTQALAQLLRKDGREVEAIELMEMIPDSLKGYSIKDIKSIAERYKYNAEGLKLSAADLKDIPLPAIVQISAKNEGNKGHYWVLEKIENDELMLFDPQSGDRYHQSPEEFSREWSGNALVFSDGRELPGVKLSDSEMEMAYGACCGIAKPPPKAGEPDDPGNEPGLPNPPPDKCSGQGSPIWKINKVNMNFFVKDIPLWYDPPIGPPVKIQLSYNSASSVDGFEPFGNKWTFNYGSYLVVNTSGQVTIFMPDGRKDVYNPNGTGAYTKPYGIFNTLTKIAENHYELTFLDGTVYVYNIPEGTSSLQPFLIEIRDSYNQKLSIGYTSDVRVSTIRDALNRVTTLVDDNNDGLIERVDDPFGRSAYFEYYPNGNLKKITDMAGYWSEFNYDEDVYLTKIETIRGKWNFYIEPPDGITHDVTSYPPPGGIMNESYRITITNPLDKKEEYFYSGTNYQGEIHYVSPRDYIFWESQYRNNSNASKTRYIFSSGSDTKIRLIYYPEGGYIQYTFDSATSKKATIKDYHNHTKIYTYNNNGLVTSFKDAKGNKTTYVYFPNGIDVQYIKYDLASTTQDDNIILKTFTYNGNTHDVETVTDRRGNVTRFSYNSYGQLQSITEAEGTSVQLSTEFIYGDHDTHNLTDIKRGGTVITHFTHDNIGRADTVTDTTGVMLTYEYNNLDQVTKVLFPDTVYDGSIPISKFVTINRSSCCTNVIDSVIDRVGLTTTYTHDSLKRLTKIEGPAGITRYGYDDNGNLTDFTNPDNKITSFEYNLDDRLTTKIYPDNKFIKYEYDRAGLLTVFTNSRNVTKTYIYDENDNITGINYSDSTPDVILTYDDYNRLDTMTDGMGIYDYGYNDLNRLESIDGPWENDTVTFYYNELGHLKNLIPQGGQTINYYYDYDPAYADADVGRLKAIQTGTNTHTYNYTGVNPLIQKLTRPYGSYTDYQYNDPLKRLTEIINKTSSGTVIDGHAFIYNNLDLIETETIETGTSLDSFTAGLTTYDYNNLNQLLNSTNPNQSFTYDDDGNMTQGYTPEGYQFTATYDAENRLETLQYTDTSVTPNIIRKTEYYYSGTGLLARIVKKNDGTTASDTRYVRAGFLPVQERDGNNSVIREYTWGLNIGGGIGGLLNLKQDGQDYSYLYDGKGNVMALIDSDQQVVTSYRYDEFGKPIKKAGSLDQPYRFSTKQYDEPTGLSIYPFRFYNPAIGKWMTRDPLGEAGGINLYNFTSNNPVNIVDPLGLFAPAIPYAAYGIGLLSAATIAYLKSPEGQAALKDINDLINDYLEQHRKEPEPERYPGERNGKNKCELNKSQPKPVPPDKNPLPPLFPDKESLKKLLQDIADLLDEIF